MNSRIAILVAAGAFALAPAMRAQNAATATFAYANQPSESVSASALRQPRPAQGQRNILELVADKLDCSNEQRLQLQGLLERQQESLNALHHDVGVNDDQKRARFQEIRQQTKQQFIAMLTPDQKRDFARMMVR